jgi:hypothetical protein
MHGMPSRVLESAVSSSKPYIYLLIQANLTISTLGNGQMVAKSKLAFQAIAFVARKGYMFTLSRVG